MCIRDRIWLEKDAATGKEEQRQRFNMEQYNIILSKLQNFYLLEAILNLENNDKFKQILFGSKKEKGKIIKWMMYIRQYKGQMKKSNKENKIVVPGKDGKMIPPNYDRKFLNIFEELMDKTYPTFFRTSLANIEKKNQIVFSYENYVNGSMEQIAGVCNEDGNVVGMMPHPERAAEKEINPNDNKPSSLIFESLIQSIGVKN